MENIFQNQILYEADPDKNDTFVWKTHTYGGYHAHFHSALEISFMLKGSCNVIVNGQLYEIEEGDIVIANPFDVHEYESAEDAFSACFIASTNYLDKYQKLYDNKLLKTHLTDKEFNKKIYSLFSDITPSYTNNTRLTTLEKMGYVNLVIGKIISKYGVTNPTRNHLEITNILKYIYNNYTKQITLESLASEFNYSKTSISRILSKHLHTDLRRFINNLRVEQVNNLLRNHAYDGYSVLQLAFQCGFESAATFYRTYKARYKCLPRK